MYGVDVEFRNDHIVKFCKRLTYVNGSAIDIPFRDNQFDVVISIDMFEHLDSKIRRKALEEMIRISKKYVLISVPCGEYSEYYERKLNYFYQKIYRRDHYWLSEHLKNGLPRTFLMRKEISDVMKIIRAKGKIRTVDNVNIKLWFLVNLFLSFPGVIYIQRILFSIFFSLFSKLNMPPTYRKIFILEFNKS